jgi:sporulation protein YlmC with PRC-barrel domain
MFSKPLSLALVGTALMAIPALGQTNQPASPMPAPSAGDRSFGANEPARMNTGSWLTQEQPGQWRASKLEGLDVYNPNNEKIGDISELLVDSSGKIQAVVVGVGGFLGIGERDVAIPMDQIKFVNEPRAAASASNTATGTTAGTAANAPATTGSTANAPAATADANRNRSAPDHAMLDMTKDQLKAAPEFKYSR